ncbi:MAG: efflux RND transporter periplasmic adaptor subunit [Gemmataceae bacterium]
MLRHLRPFALLFVTGCARLVAEPAPQTPPANPAIPVGKLERTQIQRTVEQPGRVEAFAQTPLLVKLPGYVKAIHVDIGDQVKTGQPLAELSVPETELEFAQKQAAVTQAAAEVEQAKKLLAAAEANTGSAAAAVAEAKAGRQRVKANHDRWKSEANRVAGLVERRVIDEQTRDETLNQYRAAEAMLEEVEAKVRSAEAAEIESGARRDKAKADVAVADAKAKVAAADEGRLRALLDYAKVTAPFDGVITDRRLDVGHFLQPGARETPLFVVTKTDPVRVFVDVPEIDAAFVTNDSLAVVRVQALRGRTFTGKVSRSAWALDAKAHTLHTAIDLPNPDGLLRPGMYAYATIAVKYPLAWTLPLPAVARQGDATHAYLVRNGKAAKVAVQLGAADANRTEVLKLDAGGGKWTDPTGDEVFVLKAAGVNDGQSVP